MNQLGRAVNHKFCLSTILIWNQNFRVEEDQTRGGGVGLPQGSYIIFGPPFTLQGAGWNVPPFAMVKLLTGQCQVEIFF